MRGVSWRSYAVWQRNKDVFLRLLSSEVPGIVAEPLFVLLSMGLGLGGFVGTVDNMSYLDFIAPGIVVSYAMFSASFECTYGSFVRMEIQKTFNAIIATPLNVEDVVAGEILWGATRSLITGGVIMAIVAAFGLIQSPWALLVLPIVLLQGLMFGSIAMFVTSIVPTIYTFNYFFTLFLTPMFFFSGIFFPLTSFPPLVQRLAWIAPLTPVAQMTRDLVVGGPHPWMLLATLDVLFFAAIFFTLSLFMMRRRLLK